jgi:glutamate--cysteine ligase
MRDYPFLGPNLTTAQLGPLLPLENTILNHATTIESWFKQQWQQTPAPLTSSVDLRHAGFKLAPVDTNLFPAGFNNLNQDFLPLSISAMQSVVHGYLPNCKKILLLPENHTRNQFYIQSLSILFNILTKAGFRVRIGSLDTTLTTPTVMTTDLGETMLFEPLIRTNKRLSVVDFEPDLLVLNNDLSTGIPAILQGIEQQICPTAKLGWSSRLKSDHFSFYATIAFEFAALINIDSWYINPYFKAINSIDFMAQSGVTSLADQVESMLIAIKDKYLTYQIKERPFVVVKADNGTYGMSVMMVHDADKLRQLNRKQRTKMATTKGHQTVNRVIIQEGVHSSETIVGNVAEPVIYMIGQWVVGGFYRVHQGRQHDENLNAPGMHFIPMAFNNSDANRFYAYGVIARLAALAAANEMAAIGENE